MNDTTTAPAQTATESNATEPVIDKARRMAMLEATWEICALALAIPGMCPLSDDGQEHLVVKGLALRINQLGNAIMAGLGDDAVTTRSIERKVHGELA